MIIGVLANIYRIYPIGSSIQLAVTTAPSALRAHSMNLCDGNMDCGLCCYSHTWFAPPLLPIFCPFSAHLVLTLHPLYGQFAPICSLPYTRYAPTKCHTGAQVLISVHNTEHVMTGPGWMDPHLWSGLWLTGRPLKGNFAVGTGNDWLDIRANLCSPWSRMSRGDHRAPPTYHQKNHCIVYKDGFCDHRVHLGKWVIRFHTSQYIYVMIMWSWSVDHTIIVLSSWWDHTSVFLFWWVYMR